jgi:hypothetical protein
MPIPYSIHAGKWLERIFLGTTAISVISFLTAFFVFPTMRAKAFLATLPIPLDGYLNVIYLVTIVGSFLSFFLYQIMREIRRQGVQSTPAPTQTADVKSTSMFELARVVISISLVILAFSQLNAPLDIDEAGLWSLFPTHNFAEALNPNEAPEFNYTGIPDKHHSVSIFASYVSYRLFGMSKRAVRMPAIFFCILFLFLIAYLSRRYLTRFETILLYANLCCNQLAIWYFHSSRGYISMMLLTLIPFAMIWAFTLKTQNSQVKKPFPLWLFIVATLTAPFTHTFGGGFLIILSISLIVWLFANRGQLTGAQLWQGCLFWFTLFVVTPLVGLIFLHHGQVLSTHHYVFGPSPELWSVLSGVLGANRHWWGKLTLLLMVGILWYRVAVVKDFWRDFLSLFVTIYILFFGTLIWAMKASYINPRFFLAFLVPFVIWLAQSMGKMPKGKIRNLVTVVGSVLLVIAPIIQGREITESVVGYEIEFNQFVARVLKITAPNEANCYIITGDGREATWAKNIFFFNLPKDDGTFNCTNHYHIGFLEPTPTDPSLGKVVYTDLKGRYLLRLSSPTHVVRK